MFCRIWRSFQFGSLFDLIMLDTRNYDRSITTLGWNTHYITELLNHASRTPVSYTHLRAHETLMNLVCRLLLEKKNIFLFFFFFNDTATHKIYTILFVGSVRCV